MPRATAKGREVVERRCGYLWLDENPEVEAIHLLGASSLLSPVTTVKS